MKRRDFLAGSAACSLAAMTGQAFAQSGPLTKIIFPFAAGGGGDALCRLLAQHISPVARPQRHRREPHRRRRADRHQGGEGGQPRRHHHPGDHGADDVPAADGREPHRASTPPRISCRSRSSRASSSRRRRQGRPIEVKDFKQFVSLVEGQSRTRPRYGVPSNGTIPHFTGSQLEQALGCQVTRVPYRGARRSSTI